MSKKVINKIEADIKKGGESLFMLLEHLKLNDEFITSVIKEKTKEVLNGGK